MTMKKVWFLVLVLSFMVMIPYVALADGVTPTVVNLIAGGGGKTKGVVDVGDVTVTNDADNLYVTYMTTGPWCMTATSLQVATSLAGIPQSKGNPVPGKFQYQGTSSCATTIEYPIQNTWAVGQTLDIAAYAQVTNHVISEGAWGAGTAFSGKNWAAYFTYTIQNPVVSKIIFVTSTTYTGDLEGLAGADAKCNARAAAGGLPGTYTAWLSDAATSAADRMTHNDGPYVRPDGVRIADSWTDLTDGSDIASTISITEGPPRATYNVRTATDRYGERNAYLGGYCGDWTIGVTIEYGHVFGDSGATNSRWTFGGYGGACSSLMSLYCVQQ